MTIGAEHAYSACVSSAADDFATTRVLGVDFFLGTPPEAVSWSARRAGLVVAPAAPSMVNLRYDAEYRQAILDADLAIADSGFLVLLWRLFRQEQLTRISGLAFFKALLDAPDARRPNNLFWVLPSERARARTLEFAQSKGYPVREQDCYVAPRYGKAVEDADLLTRLEQRKPKHVVIAIGGGIQDKLGYYLKHRLSYRPAIYCIGAAPGFVTGDQVSIPMWLDRLFLGWLVRVCAQPTVLLPRLWRARKLPALIIRYGRELPPPVATSID